MPTITGVTTADVLSVTGVTVTSAQLAQAQFVIEMYASIDLSDFAAFNARNRKWLWLAVCYQAGWMASQVNYMGRTDFASQSQDGLSLTPRDDTDLFLSALAQKALSRVTWLRPRSVRVRSGEHTRGQIMNRTPGQPITDGNWAYASPTESDPEVDFFN